MRLIKIYHNKQLCMLYQRATHALTQMEAMVTLAWPAYIKWQPEVGSIAGQNMVMQAYPNICINTKYSQHGTALCTL